MTFTLPTRSWGDGPLDLVYAPGWVSHVELAWEEPTLARFLNRLASFSRLIVFDKRGTGLSDRVPQAALPCLDSRREAFSAPSSWAPTPEQRRQQFEQVKRE